MYNQKHGEGRLISENGKVVESEWVAGQMHGDTVILYPNSDLFRGEVVNNEINGDGKSGTETNQDFQVCMCGTMESDITEDS